MTTVYDVVLDVTTVPPGIPPSDDGSIRGLEVEAEFYVVVLESLVFFLMWVMALLGNMLVILVIHRSRRVQSTTNFFVISIAFSDLALVLLSAPFVCVRVMMQEWAAGDAMCRLVRFVQISSMSTTSFVLVAICIDRYYTIIYPLSFKVTRGTAKRMIITAWVSAALISSLSIYFFDQVEVDGFYNNSASRHVCPTFIPARHWSGAFYAGLCIISQYITPLVLLAAGYSRTFFYILSKGNRIRWRRPASNPVPRTKVKMLKMLFIISFSTFVLYLPFYLTHIIYCISYTNYLSADVFISAFWLICTSAAIKPIIYACGNSNFLRGCKEVLCMSTMRCYRLNNYTVTNASSLSKRNYVGVLDLSKDQVSISIDSPIEPFNKLRCNDRVAWPLNGSLPSTSL